MKAFGNIAKDGQIRAIASGTLPSGRPVVVNADGTVSVVSETTVSENIGSESVFESANTQDIASGFDSTNNKVVLAYMDKGNSNYGTAVVGTVSGNSISFGTPVIFNAGQTTKMNVVFDTSNDKIVITYKNDASSDKGTARVGTVSGTSISFGTAVEFETSDAGNQAAVFDSSNNKVVVLYRDGGNSNYGTAIVGTVSGTSISFGTKVVFVSANLQRPGIGFDSTNNKVVVAYQDVSDSNKGKSRVGTVSGTSISFGTAVVFDSGALGSSDPSVLYDTNEQKIVIVYQDEYNSYKGAAIVGTVSGTDISFGTSVVFETGSAEFIDAVYDSNAKKIVVVYEDVASDEDGTVIVGTVSGTSISFGSPSVFANQQPEYCSVVFDSNSNKVVISFRDQGNSNYGTSLVYQTAHVDQNLTSENYIGMSRGSVAQTGSAQNIGTEVVFESAETEYIQCVFDSSNNKIVIVYKDAGNSNYGTAVVGTVSGDSISFGTPVVYESGQVRWQFPVFDSTNNKVVIAYRKDDDGGDGAAIVGTVSGTSISFGSSTEFESGEITSSSIPLTATFDSNEGKVVIAYSRSSSTDLGRAVVGTVSGTSISFGSLVTFQSSATARLTSTFDSNLNKVVIFYRASSEGKAIVGTVSGTSISFGSAVTFTTDTFDYPAATFDSSNNKIVLSYQNGSDVTGVANVGTVSGTSISFGSDVVFRSKNVTFLGTTFDSNANKVIVTYRNSTDSLGELVVGTVSGTSISFASEVTFNTDNTRYTSTTFDSNQNKVVIGFKDHGNNSYGTAFVFQPDTLAITRGEVADSGNVVIDSTNTISRNQIGLTAGQTLFVQTDGTLSETAGSPSVTAGTAISATELIVKG